jgi:periplasmic divalent cation tolerance protein
MQEATMNEIHYIQVMTTVDDAEGAQRIADALVGARLAACVQIIGPIASTYWWQGEINSAQEWLCLAKTRADLYAEVEAAIRAAHSYDVPEILALPIVAGSDGYLGWVDAELSRPHNSV